MSAKKKGNKKKTENKQKVEKNLDEKKVLKEAEEKNIEKKENSKSNSVEKKAEKKEVVKTQSKSEEKKDTKKEQTSKSNSTEKKNTKKEETSKSLDKKEEKKSKEEEIVFKNSKSKKKKSSEFVEEKEETSKAMNKTEKEKEKPIEKKVKKEKNTKKRIIIIAGIIILLIFALIFSICFAMIHATKDTIARGVTIKNVDVSNLTYDEAKEKLEEAFNSAIEKNINLTYEDFSYVIASADINLSYEITSALDEAYNVGRSGNIVQNNYELLKTAIFGENIDVQFEYDDDAINTIVEYVSTNVPNLVKQYSYYIEDTNLIIIPGIDGIEVDTESLKSQIIDSIQSRDLNNPEDYGVEIPYSEVIADSIDVEAIYNEIKTEPQDAYYVEATETTDFEIYADVDGVDFAITLDEAKAIVAEEGQEQYVIPLTITKASVTIDDIGFEAFPYQVSKYETTYDASNTSRSENLRIAASKIDGTVLMPGEQFSFNDVVGERTVSEGYQNAAIYQDGQVVDGLAGGICQISSTLYAAVLYANLQIDERYNHSFTTSYAKPGVDATVVYGTKDFKFTNTRSYPIKIDATVSGGVCTFIIYGIEEENEYEVKIIPVTTETTPYTTQTVEDSSLPAGSTYVTQSGANGCKVTTYKEVYLNGVQISREVISNDTYQVLTRIVKVGPAVTTTTSAETTTEETTTETPVETQTENQEPADATAETVE